jgi:hypothetical protein
MASLPTQTTRLEAGRYGSQGWLPLRHIEKIEGRTKFLIRTVKPFGLNCGRIIKKRLPAWR